MNGVKKMNKIVCLFFVISILFSGCVSGYVLEESKQQVAIRKAYMANNAKAIEGLRAGKSNNEVEVEVSTWEALKEKPLIQAGAAIADALIVWGGAECVKWIAEQSEESKQDENDSKKEQGIEDREIDSIQINGDGNTINIVSEPISETDPEPISN